MWFCYEFTVDRSPVHHAQHSWNGMEIIIPNPAVRYVHFMDWATQLDVWSVFKILINSFKNVNYPFNYLHYITL